MRTSTPLTNFAAYLPPNSTHQRIGHLDFASSTITPLSHPSGTPLSSIYEVIQYGRHAEFIPTSRSSPAADLSSVTLLPPLAERDVLAVGKNYADHAKEFNSSGFDSSDVVDRPSHPVIFTKRATSIVASGVEICPHDGWTKTLDYEGEIAVILGKEGFRISEEDAWDYVWGFTIINDVTARERQRDHKQFFIGKSADTFCPMGPVAVPITSLPSYSSLRVTTRVNSEARQSSDLSQLIFSIPTLISAISASQTIQPGDVIATGTPAGVGIGRKPPQFLRPGDEISVSVEGIGTLTNRVSASNKRPQRPLHLTAAPPPHEATLTTLPSGKKVNIERHGSQTSRDVIVFVHALGSSTGSYAPLLSPPLTDKNLVFYDLEGHGLTPTTATSTVSVNSYAADLQEVITSLSLPDDARISIVAHSLGCLISLLHASTHPVHSLVLLSPPPTPLPPAVSETVLNRGELARASGMSPVADVLTRVATSRHTQATKPLAAAFVHSLIRNGNPEGYAKGCAAYAKFTGDGLRRRELMVANQTVVVSGDDDNSVRLEWTRDTCESIGGRLVVLEGVGHWLLIEDLEGVRKVLNSVFC